MVFEYHVHNDRGLALGNTLAAIQAGVQWHSASCNGIGERAGITDTFQLLTLLHTKFAADRFNLKNVLAVSELVEAHSRIKRSPMHPVVGENAFVHVARLHQLAMQENQDAYSAFDPELINGRVSLQRYTPMHRQSLFLTPFEKSASELKYHRHGPGKRFVMLDRRLLDGSPFYFIARQFHDVGDGGPGHVDSHVHNCDSVFLFLGSDEDYRGLEVEVLLGGQLRRLQSPASVFIPAGVEHSYRYLGGSGTYINFVHKGDYHESLLRLPNEAVRQARRRLQRGPRQDRLSGFALPQPRRTRPGTRSGAGHRLRQRRLDRPPATLVPLRGRQRPGRGADRQGPRELPGDPLQRVAGGNLRAATPLRPGHQRHLLLLDGPQAGADAHGRLADPGGLFCAYKYDFPIAYGPLRDFIEHELVNKWAKHRDPRLTRYDDTLEIMGSCPHLRDCRREVFANIIFLSPEEVALFFLSTSYVTRYIEQEGGEDYADRFIAAVREIESAPQVAVNFDIHAFTALNR